MGERIPNARLRTLLKEAAWTGQDFARAVNTTGAETGVALRYDRTAVAHWLAGSRPSRTVTALAAEALSRRLGRRISPDETGLTRPCADPTAEPPPDPAAALAALADPARTSVYVVTESRRLPATGTGPTPASAALAASGTRHVGRDHIAAAEALLRSLSLADDAFGGGHGRHALAGFLGTVVTDWLRAPAAPQIRHDLLVSASRLAYLAGFMCFDGCHHGLAQDYYRTAAALAREAADPAGYAAALRGLSVQAYHLGHRALAHDLAEAAARHSPALAPAQAAFVHGQLAVAHAGRGDRTAAFAALRTARTHLERAGRDTDVVATYHAAAEAHQEAEVRTALGDHRGAIGALRTALRVRPASERRARAVTTARLAELLLGQGGLDQACAAWRDFLDDYPHLQSGRLDAAARSMRARLRPHRSSVAVRGMWGRVELAAAGRSR
ncbi:Tat pathway signal protein [Yinghuangia aomiensis]|uniref:Tat pathway signal protein n=1 Tax=Yinghuangia aomiensis TaxID=676205 RepID=A0ABP9HES2_9ACTN